MTGLTWGEIFQWVNLLLIPILLYLVRVESRLTRIETMQSAEYQYLVGRMRSSNGHAEGNES
jgi:hypothetical protein